MKSHNRNIWALWLHAVLLAASVVAGIVDSRRKRLFLIAIIDICIWALHRYLLRAVARGALKWAKRQIDELIILLGAGH